ncbi:DUF4446 family protein [Xylanibacillus composti]|uniref:DUF4446 family protein n=1 Tax=Xylanibacillus composti TaxID=1572762 RepID=A0A8J4H5I2_9BACL|nr:DUF4446 family protein [Xylanibacillus composti]MDT9725195.1 DUF4446 family protein [Xylanibacillus composti]GIQ70045.1 hypothetical protein XYCOK13_28690 [Xylanibacillus composti]
MRQEMLFGLEEQAVWLLLGTLGLSLLLFLFVILLWVRISRLRKRYLRSMGNGEAANMEQVLLDIREQLDTLHASNKAQADQFRQLEQTVAAMKGRIGFYRYNAFAERGSDLSFSLALLDADRNGVVVTSLHNREMSYVYAKPIVKGDSDYKLTPEERQAIEQAGSQG